MKPELLAKIAFATLTGTDLTLNGSEAKDLYEHLKIDPFAEVKILIEKAAKAHDDLADRQPYCTERIQARTLRRFAEVFLPKKS